MRKCRVLPTEIRKGVTVAIGQTVISDFKLKPSQVATVIEVTGPAARRRNGTRQPGGQQSRRQYITDLPIDRRDYLTFTLLAPGVSDSTRLAGDQDFESSKLRKADYPSTAATAEETA